MKENSLVGGVAAANGTSPPATAAPYTVGKLSVGSAPASAPPQPPPTAPRGGVQGALASLREKNNSTIKNVLLSFFIVRAFNSYGNDDYRFFLNQTESPTISVYCGIVDC